MAVDESGCLHFAAVTNIILDELSHQSPLHMILAKSNEFHIYCSDKTSSIGPL